MANSSIKQFVPFAWQLMKRRPASYLTGVLAVILLDAIDMIPALLVQRLTNELQRDSAALDLSFYALALVGCYLLIALLRMAWRLFLMIPSRNLERELRQECYEKLLRADFAKASRLKIGDVVSTLSQDIANIRSFMGPGILVLFDALAYLIFIPATLFYVVGPGAWWVILPFVVLGFASWLVGRPLEKGHEAVSNILGELSQYVYEESQGAKFFRAEGLLEIRRHKYDIMIRGLMQRQLGNAKWELGLDGALQTVIWGSYLMVLVLAWKGDVVSAQNLGTLTVSLQLLDKLLWPFMAVSYMMNLLQSAAAGKRRLDQVHELPEKHQGHVSLSAPLSEVRVADLSVTSSDNEPLLRSVALELKAGQRVALVGPVGSGKSVLLQTLAGLWEPSALSYREFSFAKVDYRELRRSSLWKVLSYIPQTPQIFGKSLAQNLSPHLPLEEGRLYAALEAADMHTDVQLFPDGLSTSIGEKGLNLSGGQKQRTLIARSFHSGAQLYLWDDAISALDPATERKVIANLRRLNPEAILVLATHRLSSLAEFDQILVMDKGSIVKRGTLTEIKADPTISGTLAQLEQEALSKT